MTGSLTFDDPDALAAWLTAGGVPLADWGRGEAKTVGDLWAEVACGETTLGDNPPRRTVSVVQVLIRRGERALTEIEQEMADGRRRARGWPPSEKLKRSYGVSRFSVRGKGLVWRMWSRPQTQATVRSRPRPKPLWGTLP
jgi:hypothetical protein